MWRHLAVIGEIPKARSSHTITACEKNKVYVFGGEPEPRTADDNDTYCLDVEEGKWTRVEVTGPKPSPRFGHCAAFVDDKLYVFGGRTGITMGEGALSDIQCLDTNTKTWSEVKVTGDIPEARSFSAMTSHGANLFLFGGCGASGRFNDLHKFNTESQSWSKLSTSNEIVPRGGPGLAAVGAGACSIYVIAGFTGVEVNDAYKFDVATSTWETLNINPNIPPISVFALVAVGEKLVLFGGETQPAVDGHAGAGCYTNDTYILHTDKMDKGWTKAAPGGSLPPPRGWMQATTLSDPDRIVVFGGNSPSNERLSDTYILTL